MTPKPTLPVEQGDRDAAAAFYGAHLSRPGEVLVTAHMRAGKIDESPLIQALAAHRLAAQSSPGRGAVIEECARVAEIWTSSLTPGSYERLCGHNEAAREIAEAIRALSANDTQPRDERGL